MPSTKSNTAPKTTPAPARTKATTPSVAQAAAAPAKPKLTQAERSAKALAERQAHAATVATERGKAASVFAQADKASISIPIKPLSAYKRTYKATVTAHAIGRKPSLRQATALAVAAQASKAKLTDGAKFPRVFKINGADYAIENGALSDAIAAKLCTYDSKAETITIANAAELAGQLGKASISLA